MSIQESDAPETSGLVTFLTHPQGQVVFAILALGVIVLYNSFFYLYIPYTGMEVYRDPSGEVDLVYPGGPAEESGVKVGDLLVAIDGRLLDPSRTEPHYRRGLAPGDIVIHTFLRGDQTLDLPITIGSYRDNLSALGSNLGIQVLSGAMWGIGLLLCLFVPRGDRRARLLGLGFLLAGITAAVGGASGWNSFWGANTLQLVLISYSSVILVAAHLTFPAVSLPRYRRALVNIFGMAALVISIAVVLAAWMPAAEFLSSLYPRRITLIFFLVAWLISLGLLLVNYFFAPVPDFRRQTGIVLWGLTLGVGPFFALTLLPFLLVGTEYIAGSYSVLFLLLLPLSYAYVIFQRRLLQLDFIINRLVVIFVLVLVIITLSIVLFGALVMIFDLPSELLLLGGLVAAIIATTSASLQHRVRSKVNQVLYGEHYDFSSVTASLSSQLAKTLDREKLCELLTVDLSGQMGISESKLLLNQGDRLVLSDASREPFSMPLDDEVGMVLRESQMPLRAGSLWERVSPGAKERWSRLTWGQVFVPMVFEMQLHGLLVLGPRASGDVYSDQDLRIIATVAHQGALASANVQLVEELRGLTSQLVRDDETQRKGLARELHDAVLQDLFFIKQRLHRDDGDSADIDSLLETVIQKLRSLIKAQRPVLLDQGLVLALQGLVEDMQRVTGPEPELVWQCLCKETVVLSDERATSVFRIAQEALINALKHAGAGRVMVQLDSLANGNMRLCVEDDGRGWSGERHEDESKGHFGLVGMRERAHMIGGRLHVGPRTGGGTSLVLEFPVLP